MEGLLHGIEERLKSLTAVEKSSLLSDPIASGALTAVVANWPLETKDWTPYVHFNEEGYTRNLITNAVTANGDFSLILLAWAPGQSSVIHNHDGSHCIMRVLSGELQECLFERRLEAAAYGADGCSAYSAADSSDSFTARELQLMKETRLKTNTTTYIHDSIGWHQIRNASLQEAAVSLHLYAPVIEECEVYCEREGRIVKKGSPYHSINGKRL